MNKVVKVLIFTIVYFMLLGCKGYDTSYLFLKPSKYAKENLGKLLDKEVYAVIKDKELFLVEFRNKIFGEIKVLNTGLSFSKSSELIGICYEELCEFYYNEYKPTFKNKISKHYYSYSTFSNSVWEESGLSNSVKNQIIDYLEKNEGYSEILISVKR